MNFINAKGVINPISRTATSWFGGGYVPANTGGDDGFYGSGNDSLIGGLGDDTYMAWVPSTTIVEFANGGVDTLDSRIWGETILPEHVENLLLNGPGSTAGTGNRLNNVIIAGTVGATLDGLGGDDVLVGGAGADLFRVRAGNGSDAIVGFKPGSDVIDLAGYGISTFDQLSRVATQQGNDLTLTFSNKEILVLRDVSLSQLDAYDFGFPTSHATPLGHNTLTGPGKVYSDFGWYVLNNVWNPGPLVFGTDYTIDSSFDRLNLTDGVTFDWKFPVKTAAYPTIIAYPEVIFGPAPMAGGLKSTDTGGVFPARVADIGKLTAQYDVSIDGNTDGFNVAFDIWLTDVANGGPKSITNEVMVWVHKGGVVPSGEVVGTYTEGKTTAKIYTSDSGDWTYTAVVLDQDSLTGQISVSGILAKLQSLGIVAKSEYLASLELGSEIVSGAGSLTIHDLTLNATISNKVYEVTGSGTTVHPVTSLTDLSGDDRVLYDPKLALVAGGDGSDTLLLKIGATVDLGNFSTSQMAGPTYVSGFEHVDASAATSSVTLNGSMWANTLIGGAFADKINGGAGHDILQGGAGNDVLNGGADPDRVLGQDGDDRITYDSADYSIEGGNGSDTLILTGGATVNLDRYSTSQVDGGAYVSGFEHVDASAATSSVTLNGSRYANTLAGGSERDFLTGGAGADQFIFTTTPKANTADRITDFTAPDDQILLDATGFQGLSLGGLASSAFTTGSAAADANDRIIYDAKIGSLSFDQDGSGSKYAAVQFASLDKGLAITAQDFWIIA